jgi:hypothetical protein
MGGWASEWVNGPQVVFKQSGVPSVSGTSVSELYSDLVYSVKTDLVYST